MAGSAQVPLGQQVSDAGQASAAWAQGLGSLLVQWNNMAYSIGEATLGVGGLFLCSLLFRTRLIPRFLAVGGLVGYVSLTLGMLAELFGIHIGLCCRSRASFLKWGCQCGCSSRVSSPRRTAVAWPRS